MQIVTFIKQFGYLNNMSVKEVVGRVKTHEKRHHDYDNIKEEKYLLLTHEEWLVQMKKKYMVDPSSSDTKGRD